MEPSQPARLTKKATLTRQRILDSALHLFASSGYAETSMRDIAAAAECSLGLTYRYFASKEALVLELYILLIAQQEEQARLLAAGTIADRFAHLMRAQLTLMTPHRLTLVALTGAALNPYAHVGVFGAEGAALRKRARAAYLPLVAEAKDAPRKAQVDDLATLLYGLQLAVILFWLQDVSVGAQKTTEMLDFIQSVLGRVRPLLRLPWIAQLLTRLVQIVGPLLGREPGG
jgi:AcrR family transcriptional regulator